MPDPSNLKTPHSFVLSFVRSTAPVVSYHRYLPLAHSPHSLTISPQPKWSRNAQPQNHNKSNPIPHPTPSLSYIPGADNGNPNPLLVPATVAAEVFMRQRT